MKLEMAQHILELCQCGVTEFQVACDPGVGLYAAEVVNALRENGSTIRLVCVLPHEEQATKWTPQLRERYFNMLSTSAELDCIDCHEQPNAQLLAYQRIIKQSTVVLAVYDPDLADGSAEDKAVSYALALGRPVMLIHPETLKTKWLNVPTEKAPGEAVPQPKSPVSYFGTIYISVRGCIINLNDYKSCRKRY